MYKRKININKKRKCKLKVHKIDRLAVSLVRDIHYARGSCSNFGCTLEM